MRDGDCGGDTNAIQEIQMYSYLSTNCNIQFQTHLYCYMTLYVRIGLVVDGSVLGVLVEAPHEVPAQGDELSYRAILICHQPSSMG
jgi:hypothetical protein